MLVPNLKKIGEKLLPLELKDLNTSVKNHSKYFSGPGLVLIFVVHGLGSYHDMNSSLKQEIKLKSVMKHFKRLC